MCIFPSKGGETSHAIADRNLLTLASHSTGQIRSCAPHLLEQSAAILWNRCVRNKKECHLKRPRDQLEVDSFRLSFDFSVRRDLSFTPTESLESLSSFFDFLFFLEDSINLNEALRCS